jgi:hypothetical protein
MQQLVELQFNRSTMKTNQIFNFKRFERYSINSFILNYRQLSLMGGVSIVGILLTCFLTTNNNGQMNDNYWRDLFFFLFSVFGLLFVGTAFNSLRSREKTLWFLMVPSSIFEKFLYNLIERIVLFFLVFPVIFYLFGNLALSIVRFINSIRGESIDQLLDFSIWMFFKKESWGFICLLMTGAFFFLSLAFAGATTFRKYPLIKSIIFVGSVIILSIGYIYILTQKLHLNNPWIRTIGDRLNNDQAMFLVSLTMFLSGLITLAFAYFKLKEKEVQ